MYINKIVAVSRLQRTGDIKYGSVSTLPKCLSSVAVHVVSTCKYVRTSYSFISVINFFACIKSEN